MLTAMLGRQQSPFPGMDPWLEHPASWPNVHQSLITYARDALQSRIGDRYFVSIGERIYVEPAGSDYYPDVHVTQAARRGEAATSGEADQPVLVVVADAEHREVFLEIVEARSQSPVVTVIEVLSPANKRPGPGRDVYLRKQGDLLASASHLVEIDLLRGGAPTVAIPAQQQAGDYRVVVSRADRRRHRELYPISLRDRLPRVAVPLLQSDHTVLDLQALFAETWQKSGLGNRIDYTKPPVPPLAAADEQWARQLLGAS